MSAASCTAPCSKTTAVTTHSEGEEPNRHVVITLKQQN